MKRKWCLKRCVFGTVLQDSQCVNYIYCLFVLLILKCRTKEEVNETVDIENSAVNIYLHHTLPKLRHICISRNNKRN